MHCRWDEWVGPERLLKDTPQNRAYQTELDSKAKESGSGGKGSKRKSDAGDSKKGGGSKKRKTDEDDTVEVCD